MPTAKLAYFSNIGFTQSSSTVITEQERKAFAEKLSQGGKNGARLKKIKTKPYVIYSARFSKAGRFLCTLIEQPGKAPIISVLDKFESHDEYIQKINSNVLLASYLKDLSPEDIEMIFSEDEETDINPDSKLTSEEYTLFHQAFSAPAVELYYALENHYVELNETQRIIIKAKDGKIIRILEGSLGTGKTIGLTARYEEIYAKVSSMAMQPETKHSTEMIHQLIYLTITPALAEEVQEHFDTKLMEQALLAWCMHKNLKPTDYGHSISPVIFFEQLYLYTQYAEEQLSKVQLPKSMTYQAFAEMLDPSLKTTPLKEEKDFIAWCLTKKIKPSDYGLADNMPPANFYRQLYQEFRIISGCDNLQAYKDLGITESLFIKDLTLRESLFTLYTQYIENNVDLNFYDLSEAINTYKQKNPNIVPQLFGDESQNLSKRQLKNCMYYAAPNITFCADPEQSVYDPIPNAQFLKQLCIKQNLTPEYIPLTQSYRVTQPVAEVLNRLSTLQNQYNGGVINAETNPEKIVSQKEGAPPTLITVSELKDAIEEKYQQYCDSSDYAVVVGEASLIDEAQKKFKTPLVFTPDEIIGLTKNIIFYKPFNAFTTDELKTLIPFCTDPNATHHPHKPKDKHDKTKQSLNTKINQLRVAIGRSPQSLDLIINDTAHKRSKQKNPEEMLAQYLGIEKPPIKNASPCTETKTKAETKTETESDLTTPNEQQNNRQKWLEECRKLIVKKKYKQAYDTRIARGFSVAELNIPESFKAQIPTEYHAAFFLSEKKNPMPKSVNTQKHPEVIPTSDNKENLPLAVNSNTHSKTLQPTENQKISGNEKRAIDFLSSFNEDRILSLFKKQTVNNLREILFEIKIKNGNDIIEKNLWDILTKDQKRILSDVLEKHQLIEKFKAVISEYPDAQYTEKNTSPSKNLKSNCLARYEGGKLVLSAKAERAFSEANKKYRAGVLKGDAESAYQLAYHHAYGYGVEKDEVEAVRLYRLAGNKGHAQAQIELGNYYFNGDGGVLKDLKVAAELYQKAAIQGNPQAQHNLGKCYEFGFGVPIDLSKAAYWYKKSSDQGDKDAAERLRAIQTQPKQISTQGKNFEEETSSLTKTEELMNHSSEDHKKPLQFSVSKTTENLTEDKENQPLPENNTVCIKMPI